MENYRDFHNVDSRVEKNFFFDFLDAADAEPGIRRYRTRMVELCPDGQAIGLDRSESMIAEARRRSGSIRRHTDFLVGDIHALNFDDETFDIVRAEKVLLYVSDPLLAMTELARHDYHSANAKRPDLCRLGFTGRSIVEYGKRRGRRDQHQRGQGQLQVG